MEKNILLRVLGALLFIIVINVSYFFAASVYLYVYSVFYESVSSKAPQLLYIYLLVLPATLVFVVSREASSSLRVSTQLAVFLCISLTNQFSFSHFYLVNLCVQLPGEESGEVAGNIEEILYFSFLTFGTLGYGDFTPSTSCRPVSAIQSIFGVMAVAVLISLISRQRTIKTENHFLKEYSYSATELADEVLKHCKDLDRKAVWKAIADNGMKKDTNYSAYNFRSKKQKDKFERTGIVASGVPSIYNERAVDQLVKTLKS